MIGGPICIHRERAKRRSSDQNLKSSRIWLKMMKLNGVCFDSSANQAFQQQQPLCFGAYVEQESWLMQQQLPHLYWDQYAEPEQENFPSEKPWQPPWNHYDAPEQEEFQSVQLCLT
ncbi:uncharacterized protein LOC111242348 [Vigna radiata var. radiata]|uniref:Uncharacterized protein LOC111242348 n=1 Tax=Vigna radiata var. radiata TaxID=3916 RepID=A0A3Q0FAL4_VIGRR|nr:uncharacterized protein LOC111242348 [Vigna radiata var. radiata]